MSLPMAFRATASSTSKVITVGLYRRGAGRGCFAPWRLGDDGEPLVDERPWRAPSVAHDVKQAAGENARLVAWTGPERFDVLPLLVATDGALAALGYDARRFRPNIIIGAFRPGRTELGRPSLSIGGA